MDGRQTASAEGTNPSPSPANDQSDSTLAQQLRDLSATVTMLTEKLSEAEPALKRAQARESAYAKAAAALQAKIDDLEARALDHASRTDKCILEAEGKVANQTARQEQAIEAATAKLQSLTNEQAQRSQTKLAEIEAAAQTASEKLSAAGIAADSVNTHRERAKQLLSELETIRTESLSHHSVTSETLAAKQKFEADTAATMARVTQALSEAENYNAAFIQDRDAFEFEIKRLIGEAEGMLFGATNAGIASAFKDEVKALDKLIASGTAMFLFGIAALGLSLVPLFNYMTNVAAGHEITVASVLARSVILVPAGWLALHYARRIHANFDLRQQYVHKYALAASVEPFRRQGGEEASTAIAGVLRELMKNPAAVMRRHRKMGDGPAEAVQDVVQPITKLISGPQN